MCSKTFVERKNKTINQQQKNLIDNAQQLFKEHRAKTTHTWTKRISRIKAYHRQGEAINIHKIDCFEILEIMNAPSNAYEMNLGVFAPVFGWSGDDGPYICVDLVIISVVKC